MKIRAREVPDRVKAGLDLAPEDERHAIVFNFVLAADAEPRLRRFDIFNVVVSIVAIAAQLYVIGRYDLDLVTMINLAAAIVLALTLRATIRRARRRRVELEILAAMATYIMGVYPPR